jgi:peptidoglycan/LPS O-acetylase OafA/YrhL
LHAVTYTTNYHVNTFSVTDRPLWAWEFNHLWSLAVEEQFYLVWPCLLVWLGPRRALWVAAAALVLCPVCRWVMWYELCATPTAMTRRFQAVADALATGCLLAGCFNRLSRNQRYMRFLRSPVALPLALGGVLTALGTAAVGKGVYYVLGQTLANLSIALLIDLYVRFPRRVTGQLLNWPPVAFVGVLSYSLYLWQEPFLNPMSDAPAYVADFPRNLGFAATAAVASYFLVEQPFLRLKDRLSRAKREGATV